MALVKCDDCGHQVSTDAAACPNCGRPMKAAPEPTPAPPPTVVSASPPAAPKRSWFRRHKILTAILALIVIGAIGSRRFKREEQRISSRSVRKQRLRGRVGTDHGPESPGAFKMCPAA